MRPSVNEKIKTAVPTALIFGSKPVTNEVQILMGRVISKFVKKYAITNSSNEKVKVSRIVANIVGAQIGTKIKQIDVSRLEPNEIAASSIELGILSILFFKFMTAKGKTYRDCPIRTSHRAGWIPIETI